MNLSTANRILAYVGLVLAVKLTTPPGREGDFTAPGSYLSLHLMTRRAYDAAPGRTVGGAS